VVVEREAEPSVSQPINNQPTSAQPEKAEHVILLSLDTFRADASGWLGDPARSLTPSLDAFARDAVVFERARAQIPSTQPSHTSMFTGLYPLVHRVNGERAALHPRIRTLPQILQDHGFSTRGYYVNFWLKGGFGFGRGFDRYELIEGGATHADHLNAAVFEALEQTLAEDRAGNG
jgi:arylsulfatase A-like enzyme